MIRYYYEAKVTDFIKEDDEAILGKLSESSEFDVTVDQINSWKREIEIIKEVVSNYEDGHVVFEYDIPRLGRRIDVTLLINGIVFVLEFKVGSDEFLRQDIEQVWDYALDLKNFQEDSHERVIVPILVATDAPERSIEWRRCIYDDNVYEPLCTNAELLSDLIKNIQCDIIKIHKRLFNDHLWMYSRYSPTPTIIQAASYMYRNHSVENITKTEATDKSLKNTTDKILEIVKKTKDNKEKAICFVTGVPGAGKTLVGLNVAIQQFAKNDEGDKEMAVYLSGNGPLVEVLTEALARDKKKQAIEKGERCNITDARREVKSFIQIIHHYRNDYLAVLKSNREGLVLEDGKLQVDEAKYKKLDGTKFEGVENVAIFDEAQRAWTKDALASWLKRKKNIPNFPYSEPEFLIWSLDLKKDWALIVCLVGGGQEINTGEAGISEWINAINERFTDWKVYISPNLVEKEYDEGNVLNKIKNNPNVTTVEDLHLSVSMRAFRAESLSKLVHNILDFEKENAIAEYNNIKEKYPIVITRDINKAKKWLKEKARGSERYGIMCSSQAYRLRPLAIDVRVNPDTVHWFLDDENDIRSSQFLEDVTTEFQVQGLELDWTCVVWDADFRFSKNGWINKEFKSSKWNNINRIERKNYQKNAYRVLLTRARQGMIICVPEGDASDETRLPEFYDETFEYLKSIGFEEI